MDWHQNRNRYVSGLWFVAAALLAAAVPVIFFQLPTLYAQLVVEDGWGETTTFVSFSTAALVFFVLFLRQGPPARKFWFALLALAAAAVALEEISWGQRIMGVPTPDVLRARNFQGEMNLHNLSQSAMHSIYPLLTLSVALYGLVLIFARSSVPVDRLVKWLRVPVPSPVLLPLFLAPACFWFLTEFVRRDELVELFVGAGLLGLAVEQISAGNKGVFGRRSLHVPAALAGCFIAGLVLTSALNTEESTRSALLKMSTATLPDAGFYAQAEKILARLERDPELAGMGEAALASGKLLLALGRADEAYAAFKRARDDALASLSASPGDPATLVRLAEAHRFLGSSRLSNEYAYQALASLDAKLLEGAATKMEQRSSRPAWTYRIWSATNPDREALLIMQRGDAYRAIGECDHAAHEYLEAASRAQWANTTIRLRDRMESISVDCGESPRPRGFQRLPAAFSAAASGLR